MLFMVTMVGVGQADKKKIHGGWSRTVTPIGTDTGGHAYTHSQSSTDAGASILFHMFSFEI